MVNENLNDKIPYSILFVEDEKETRENYVNYLKRYYTYVYEAKDGVEAYDIYLDKKPMILILDINMPRMNGLELLQKIRQKDHNVKCLMLTAHTDKEFLIKATQLKLTDYLLKPLKRIALREALVKVINEIENYEVVSKKILDLADGYIWNIRESKLLLNSHEVILTGSEIKLLELFFKNTNINLSYDDIIIYIWDTFEEDKTDALKAIIKKLRKKLPENLIQNIYGIGYKIVL